MSKIGDENKWCWTRLKEARDRNPKDSYKCWSESIQVLAESCCLLVIFIIENLIGILFIIMGIIYMDDCPVSHAIPISLLLFGAFSFLHGITLQLVRCKCFNMTDPKDGFATLIKIALCMTSFATFFAFLFAAIVVYGSYDMVATNDPKSAHYCNHFFYWFSFFFITFVIILCVFIVVLFCCLLCFLMGTAAANDDTPHSVVIIHQESAPKK